MVNPCANPPTLQLAPPTPAETHALQTWLATVAAAEPEPALRPFFILTPLGQPFRARIAAWLADHQLVSVGQTDLFPWPRLSSALYAKQASFERAQVAALFESVWQTISLAQTAERWELAGEADLRRLAELKPQLRAELGTRCFRLAAPPVTLRAPDQVIRLQAIHVPDPEQWALEARRLAAALRCLG